MSKKHKQKHSTKSLELRCSFCKNSEDQVDRLVAGPRGIYICDECVGLCNEIIEEDIIKKGHNKLSQDEEEFDYLTAEMFDNFLENGPPAHYIDCLQDSQDDGRLIINIGDPITRNAIEEITLTKSVTFKLRK